MVANISLILAGAMGGGLGDKPRWVNIFWIAIGLKIALMIFSSPLQYLHLLTSISNTRASRSIRKTNTFFKVYQIYAICVDVNLIDK